MSQEVKIDVTTVAGLLAWHMAFVPEDSEYHGKPLDGACYWAMYQLARELIDGRKTAALAGMFERGVAPFATEPMLADWLKAKVLEYGIAPTSKEAARTAIKLSLRNFWLMGGEGDFSVEEEDQTKEDDGKAR